MELLEIIQKKQEQLLHIASKDNHLINILNSDDVFSLKTDYKTMYSHIMTSLGEIPSMALTLSSKVKNNIVLNRNGILIDWCDLDNFKNIINLYKLKKVASDAVIQTGFNPLFISIGSITWNPTLDEKIVSPLLIIPVKMVVSGGDSQPVMLEFIDDEGYLNPALLLKLKLDRGIIDFPSISKDNIIDYDTFDITSYFNEVESYISNLVTNSTITFNKDDIYLSKTNTFDICMYNDIKRHKDAILNSDTIKAIFCEKSPLPKTDIKTDIDTLDYCKDMSVLPMDKSQSYLISKVKAGDSLIIQGPPGTGKSQTITNIIANLLNEGKKILFVSQKMAALEEVYNKMPLELQPFLLRIDYERETLKMNVATTFTDIKATYNQVMNNKSDLNYISDLYARKDSCAKTIKGLLNELKARDMVLFSSINTIGFSKYDLMGCILNNDENSLEHVIVKPINYSLDKYKNIINDITLFDTIYKNSPLDKPLIYNPWYGLNDDLLNDKKFINELIVKGNSALKLHNDIKSKFDSFYTLSSMNLEYIRVINESQLDLNFINSIIKNRDNDDFTNFINDLDDKEYQEAYAYLCSHNLKHNKISMDDFHLEEFSITELKDLSNNVTGILGDIKNDNKTIFLSGAKDYLAMTKRIDEILPNILNIFNIDVLKLEFDYKAIDDMDQEKYGLFDLKAKKLFNQLIQYLKDKMINHHTLYLSLKDLEEYQGLNKKLENANYKNKLFKDYDSKALDLIVNLNKKDIDNLDDEINRAISLLETVGANPQETINLNMLIKYLDIINKFMDNRYEKSILYFKNNEAIYCDTSLLIKEVASYKNLSFILTNHLDKIEEVVNYIKSDEMTIYLNNINNLLNDALKPISLFNYLTMTKFLSSLNKEASKQYFELMNQIKLEIKNKEALDFIDDFFKKGHLSMKPLKVYEKTFNETLLNDYNNIINDVTYSRPYYEQKLTMLDSNLKEILLVNKEIIASDLSDDIRNEVNKDKDSYAYFQTQNRHKSMRALFKNKPNEIKNLKRCLMMTPSSIAQLLQTNDYHDFDVVIFDEASQVKPERAIGAIYRGKQVIVVGDPKQMAKDDLFVSNSYDDYYQINDDDHSAQKSILDTIVDNENMEMLVLKTHYRSLYENLIKFSNENFYDSSLITFPSLKLHGEYVGLISSYVDNGNMVNGKNEAEARRVIEILKDIIIKKPKKSIGIVGYGKSQVDEITSMINNDQELYKTINKLEEANKFFIRTLDNVQGHEMDYIILSMTYGRVNGKLNQNFGMLNRDVDNDETGKKCFNVAITRAKESLIIVHSVKSSELTNENLKMVKNFIYLAESEQDTSLKRFEKLETNEEAFANSIGKFILDNISDKNRVVYHYGICSNSYRIPIAILSPDLKEVKLAIMLEYKTSNSISLLDNYVNYYNMLKVRGFRVYKIFADLWYNNINKEKEALLKEMLMCI